jgi:hypothetical protein
MSCVGRFTKANSTEIVVDNSKNHPLLLFSPFSSNFRNSTFSEIEICQSNTSTNDIQIKYGLKYHRIFSDKLIVIFLYPNMHEMFETTIQPFGIISQRSHVFWFIYAWLPWQPFPKIKKKSL